MERTATNPGFDVFALGKDVTVTRVTAIGQGVRDFIRTHPDKSLVLDLSATEYIDSSGLNLLINIDKNLKASGRRCYLLHPSRPVQETLEQTKLGMVLSVVDSCDEIDDVPASSAGVLDIYGAHTTPEGQFRRLLCACPVCSSRHIIGYLVDPSDYTWSWDEGALLPKSVHTGSGEEVDFYALRAIVCMECFMSSTDVRHFNAGSGGESGIPSSLEPRAVAALGRTNKRRKEIMDIGKVIGDVFFEAPRSNEASCQAYLLAAECARSFKVTGNNPCPSTLGRLYYCAYAYANSSQEQTALSNSRAWLTKAIQDRDSSSPIDIARSAFMLMNVSFKCEKEKEAAAALSVITETIKDTAPSTVSDINDPHFWLEGAKLLAESSGLA